MNVLFASVEMYPLAKVGGLGDVAGSLPEHIRQHGVDIRVVMPYHRFISARVEKVGNMKVDGEEYGIYETCVGNVPVYLVRNDFISRDRVYGYDDPLRWARFSKIIPEIPKFLKWDVDIIHINDWMTSLSPIYSKMVDENFKFLLTIHNLKHQGEIEDRFQELGIDDRFKKHLTWMGKINYMKGGIILSDAINTVSPTYAREITTEQYGEGLHKILRENSYKLHGILNGIDYGVWNPENDRFIYENYGIGDLEGKRKNREKMKEELGIDDDYPLIGFVARLVEQKGIDIMVESMVKLRKAHLIILGTGKERYEREIMNIRGRYVHPIIRYDEELAHRIYASSDMFLMPSKFEPCGLGQLIAMRYGSVPIVRKTGGLADTVVDVSEGGWGFLFENYNAAELLRTVERAIHHYGHGEWDKIVKRAMSQDFSWRRSSERYVELYRRIL